MSLDELKNERKISELILAILYLVQKDLIPKDPALFHPAFKEMQDTVQLPLLSQLTFDLSSSVPFSEELEQGLSALEASGLLPYADGQYIMSETRLQQVNTYIRFSEEAKAQILNCSVIFSKYLPKEETQSLNVRR